MFRGVHWLLDLSDDGIWKYYCKLLVIAAIFSGYICPSHPHSPFSWTLLVLSLLLINLLLKFILYHVLICIIVSHSGAELYSMYVGEGEALLRNTFRRARLAAPSILFFDEADVIAARRLLYCLYSLIWATFVSFVSIYCIFSITEWFHALIVITEAIQSPKKVCFLMIIFVSLNLNCGIVVPATNPDIGLKVYHRRKKIWGEKGQTTKWWGGEFSVRKYILEGIFYQSRGSKFCSTCSYKYMM